MLDAFGFESWTAPGEAEAELAYLNQSGVIDAVLSDDIDCFLFGALYVIRNSSKILGKDSGKDDGHHVSMYSSKDLAEHADVSLTRGGLILVALLCGGDYDVNGVRGCGVNTAHALARAGYGDTLLSAALTSSPQQLKIFLSTWQNDLRDELLTNSSGFGARKCPTLAGRLSKEFPRLNVLRCYTHPMTSETESQPAMRDLDNLWKNQVDIGKLAHFCETYFEWGVEKDIIKRFRNLVWNGAVLRSLLNYDLKETKKDHFGPMKIHAERKHGSTDHLLEYRLEITPRSLVKLAKAGIEGTRTMIHDSAALEMEDVLFTEEEVQRDLKGKEPPNPDATLRIWIPAVIVEYACPDLASGFKEVMSKRKRVAAKGKDVDRGTRATRPTLGRADRQAVPKSLLVKLMLNPPDFRRYADVLNREDDLISKSGEPRALNLSHARAPSAYNGPSGAQATVSLSKSARRSLGHTSLLTLNTQVPRGRSDSLHDMTQSPDTQQMGQRAGSKRSADWDTEIRDTEMIVISSDSEVSDSGKAMGKSASRGRRLEEYNNEVIDLT